ncbi:hypothetical protein ACFYU5_19005 [Nocardia aobensis]|uniref:Uncharacterized protein n=1 Tax=Nocardia aobensis TaxID=257277 RepID=A0ABW6P5S2_9NOCA
MSDPAPRWKDGTVASVPDLERVLNAFLFRSEADYERFCRHHDEKRAAAKSLDWKEIGREYLSGEGNE